MRPLRLSQALARAFILRKSVDQHLIDLIEMRRQLVALRSCHSENLRAVHLLNTLLVKISFLNEPKDTTHARRIGEAFASTIEAVGQIIAQSNHD
jgi:hypothetical protein